MYGSYMGSGNQVPPNDLGQIAVSPDGNTIAYFTGLSHDELICYYSYIDGVNYAFNNMPVPDTWEVEGTGTLQFISPDDLFYISIMPYFNGVHHYKFEEAYCENPSITSPDAWPLP